MTAHPHPVGARRTLVRASLLGVLPLAICLFAGCTKETEEPGGNGGEVSQADDSNGAAGDSRDARELAHANGDAAPDGSPGKSPAASDREQASDRGSSAPSDVPDATPAPPQNGQPASPSPPAANGSKQSAPVVGSAPRPAPPPAEVHPPDVILTQQHAQTCAVQVGDAFPALTLPDRDGNPQELSQLYGDRMTIVVFWNAEEIYAREQFARIMQEGRDRYHGLGINVVTINVGDAPEVVQELAEKHAVTIPCLLDRDGQAFHLVATDLLPRTYLLDAEGRVLWFDLEYSRGQRLSLHNAVHYHLKQSGA